MPTGAELFVDAIRQLGVNRIFTLVGDHLNAALQCAAARGLEIFDMRHESAVVHAADAWTRITRRPAVALVTGGPGHTNSLTGVATAFAVGSPVITVSGSRPSTQAERGAFQDLDQLAMIRPVVKWAATPPSAGQIPFYVRRAWSEATAGRMGPVHLTIPVDLFTAQANESAQQMAPAPYRAPAPDSRDIDRAVAMLRSAARPIVIAGSGVWWARAEENLRRFAEQTRLPLFTIALGRGALPDQHPCSFGYADPALNRAAAKAFQEADLFLALGKRIDFRFGLGSARVFPAGAKFIQVDIEPTELGLNRRVDLGICADVGAALTALADASGPNPWPELPWIARLRSLTAEWRDELEIIAGDAAVPLHPAAVYRELKRVLPAGTLYSWDGGDFVHWGRAMIPASTPVGCLRLGPMATIGAGLPNALALKLANPSPPVVLITGDGALGCYIAELDTPVRHNLPIVIVVGNDAGWGLERELQGGRDTVACELRRTRYDQVMQGFGGCGELIQTLDQVRPAVERALASARPYVLHVEIRGVRSPFTTWRLGG